MSPDEMTLTSTLASTVILTHTAITTPHPMPTRHRPFWSLVQTRRMSPATLQQPTISPPSVERHALCNTAAAWLALAYSPGSNNPDVRWHACSS